MGISCGQNFATWCGSGVGPLAHATRLTPHQHPPSTPVDLWETPFGVPDMVSGPRSSLSTAGTVAYDGPLPSG